MHLVVVERFSFRQLVQLCNLWHVSVCICICIFSHLGYLHSTLTGGRQTHADTFICMNGPMRAQALIASNWIAIDRELAYFSFVFADIAGVDPSRRYSRNRGSLEAVGCTGREGKGSGWPEEATTLFDEDLRSCFDLCQHRPPANSGNDNGNDSAFLAIHLLIHDPSPLNHLVVGANDLAQQ